MTVNTTEITSGPYTGNGITTDFAYTFRIEDKSQVRVFETTDLGVEAELTVDTDYTVAGIGVDAGGTITRVAGALPSNYTWFIRSDYEETQDTAFASQGGFFPDVHESAIDKLTFLVQQLRDSVNRSAKLSESYSGAGTATLPDPVAGLYLRWRTDLLGFENTGVPSVLVNTENFDIVADMQASTSLSIGNVVDTLGYNTKLDGGASRYEIVAAATGTDDGGKYIDLPGSGLQARNVFTTTVNLSQYGALFDGITEDTVKIQAAIDYVESVGGGTIISSEGDSHCKQITINGDNVHILGYGSRLIDINPSVQVDATRITIASTADNTTIEGLTVYTTHTTGSNWNTDIAGTNTTLLNYTVTRPDPELQGNVGFYLRAADGVDMIGCRFETGNMIWTSAKNVRVNSCHLHGGGDDGIAVKASTASIITENITISNCTFKNFTNMLACGTEVQNGAIIRRVTMSNCVGENVGSVTWVKPGRTDVNYYNGIIRDVHVTNCHAYLDPATADPRLSSVLWIDCDNGGKVYNVNMENCSLRGRWNNDPVGSRFGLLTILTNGDIAGSGSTSESDTVDGVTMSNCHWIDEFDGAANSGPTPGYPIDGVGNISMTTNTAHTIKNVKLVDCTANGSETSGFSVGTNGNTGTEFGKVELIRPIFTNVSTAPITVDQASGIRSKTAVTIKGADVTMGTGTTVAISSTDANDTADVYIGEEAYFNIGNVGAASSQDKDIFVAPSKCFVSNIELVNAANITPDAVNNVEFTVTNEAQASTLVAAVNSDDITINANTPVALSSDPFTATGTWMAKGETLRLQVAQNGTGQATTRMQAIIRYVTY